MRKFVFWFLQIVPKSFHIVELKKLNVAGVILQWNMFFQQQSTISTMANEILNLLLAGIDELRWKMRVILQR